MDREVTPRGFPYYNFKDKYNSDCTILKSSLADDQCIWFGLDEADPMIMASKVKEGGTGWVKYPLHEDVFIATRMHLSREQVETLMPVLQKFVDTGEI